MDWLQIAQDYGFTVVIILFLVLIISKLLRVLLDEDKSSLFRARMYKTLLLFSKRRDHEKKFISNDIKGRLNLARKNLHFGQISLPKAVNVEWIDGTDPKSYNISEGEFVVCLDPANEQEKNIVCLAQALVQRSSLIGIRHIINRPLQKALDVTLTKRLLQKTKHSPSLYWFHSNIIENVTKTGGITSLWHSKVTEIDEQGLFNLI